ncbi:MAG: DNA polymerase IV [Candidatus Omnitrophica bacterium]|nr:DNA polymerase IV [Candidatus Omnitrophota bacterium]
MNNKIILHIDMDAFFASVEQAANPVYKGKPFLVGSRGRKFHTVVAACSYEAKAFGIHSGMATKEALRLCPWAEFVPADSSKYVYTSDRIEEILKVYSDRMERASIDEFYLDLSPRDLKTAINIAQEIKSRIKNTFFITASAGIAPSKIIAKMAAKAGKPDGLLVLEEKDVLPFLENLPIEKVPGIGAHLKGYLNNISVFTCGQLRRVDSLELIRRFGKVGLWMVQVSSGQDDEEVGYWQDEDLPPKSVSHSYTLAKAIFRGQDLEAWILMLSEMVAFRLRKQGLESRVSSLYLRGSETAFSREKNFQSLTADPARIYERNLLILESFRLKNFPVRALGVCASALAPAQGFYLFPADQKRRSLLDAVDSINQRLGDWSIYPAAISRVKN